MDPARRHALELFDHLVGADRKVRCGSRIPIASAVWRLMTNSNLVRSSTGMSPADVPLSSLAAKRASWR